MKNYKESLVNRSAVTRAAVNLAIGALFVAWGSSQVTARERSVQQFGYIPLADGVQIAYTLHRPSEQGRFPTLLIYNMYDASIVGPYWNQTVLADVSDYLEAGYAVVGANVRGTGCSTGVQDPLHAEQVGRDGAEVVEWIARQPWSDGGVGMFGHSGSGITQFYVAAQNPKPLKAIIPGAAPADIYRDIGYPGGMFNYAFMYMWSQGAQPENSERAAKRHIESGDTACADTARNRTPNPTWEQMQKHPLVDEWHVKHSVNSVASRIKVPTYIVFGWQDQSVLSTAIRAFDLLQGPRKMLLAEGSHSFYIGSNEVRREKIRFFDHWLKGKANSAMEGKPIKIWLSTKGSFEPIPDRVVEIERLPVKNTQWTKLYFSRNKTRETSKEGSLVAETPAKSSTAEYLYPAGAAYVFGQDKYPHKPADIGGFVFRSEPFAEEKVLLGSSIVRLYAASTQADTTFLVMLSEIDEAGKSKYLQRGYLQASLRQLDPTSTPTEPRYSFNKTVPLEPGKVTEFVIALNPTGSIIAKGHSLEVVVMVPSMGPEPIGGWGFLPAAMGMNTIHMSPEYPSHVVLPVVDPRRLE